MLFQDWPEANIPSWEVQGYIMRKASERTQWQQRNPQLFFRGGLHPGLAPSSGKLCSIGCNWRQTHLGRHKAATCGSRWDVTDQAVFRSGAILISLRLAGQRGVVEGVDWQPLAKHFDVTFFSSPHDMGTVRCAFLSGHSDSRQLSKLIALQRLACLQEWLHSPPSALRLEVPPQLASSVFLLGKRCMPELHIFCSAE